MSALGLSTQKACDSLIGAGISTDGDIGQASVGAEQKLIAKLQSIFTSKNYTWGANNLIGVRMDDIFTDQFTDIGIIVMGANLYAFPMSTKPGSYWLTHADTGAANGCACVLEGQYHNMWQWHDVVGGWSGEPYCQQIANTTVIRQKNKTAGMSIDRTVTPISGIFGINFHTWGTYNGPTVGNLSAGCQVMDSSVLVDELVVYMNQFANPITYTLLHKNMF
jgi:hypothetical protein